MGMYSSVRDNSLEWRSEKAREAFLEWASAKDPPDYVSAARKREHADPELKSAEHWAAGYEHWRKLLATQWKNDLDGLAFDDIKLIGYWYQSLSAIFRDIAQWVEGYIKWEYETGDEFVIIKFENGMAYVSMGTVVFDEPTALENFIQVPELPNRERLLRGV